MYNCDVNDTSCYHTAYNNNGYGGMAYYSSVDCGYGTESNSTLTGCKNDYESSEIKYVVDAWKTAQAPSAIEARLFSKDEYQEYCVKEEYQSTPSDTSTRYVPQYDWMFNNNYLYWTNTPYTDSSTDVWFVGYDGDLVSVYTIYSSNIMVRPVIVLPKSALN